MLYTFALQLISKFGLYKEQAYIYDKHIAIS